MVEQQHLPVADSTTERLMVECFLSYCSLTDLYVGVSVFLTVLTSSISETKDKFHTELKKRTSSSESPAQRNNILS